MAEQDTGTKLTLPQKGQGYLGVCSCPSLAKPRTQPFLNFTIINSTATPSLSVFISFTLFAFQKLLEQSMTTRSHFTPHPYSLTSLQSPPTSIPLLSGW